MGPTGRLFVLMGSRARVVGFRGYQGTGRRVWVPRRRSKELVGTTAHVGGFDGYYGAGRRSSWVPRPMSED